MTRTILAPLLAAALMLAPAAPPARAEEGRELLGLLLGIGLFHAIGKGIERARAPEVPRTAIAPVSAAPGPCAETRVAESRGLGAACFARLQNAASADEAWHGASHWYGAERVRP